MSLAAYLTAVRNRLRTQLSLDDEQCGVQPDGQPPPACGDKYIAVHGISWFPQGDHDDGLHEEFGIDCTISLRIPAIPRDRIGDELYIKLSSGIEAIARQVMAEIDRGYTIMNAANTLLANWSQGSAGFFQVPFRWTGTDAAARLMDGSWAFADPSAMSFLVTSVHFGRAHRHQVLAGRD